MSSQLEAEIQSLLADSGEVSLVADLLLRRWERNILSAEDVRAFTRFLINAQLYPTLLTQIRNRLGDEAPVPWGAFVECLAQMGVALESFEIEALYEGARRYDGGLDDLSDSRALDPVKPQVAQHRQKRLSRLREELDERRQDLRRRLEYARVNRLLQQERKALEELHLLDPDDPEVRREKNALAFREAQDVIDAALSHSPPREELELKALEIPADLKPEAHALIAQVQKRAAESPHEALVYDLALLLINMDLPAAAADLLDKHRQLPSLRYRLLWLRLEALLFAKQYAGALADVQVLESKLFGQPDATFALTYARAQALWGLKETVTAIELMRGIVKVRPGYRLANSLLLQWQTEAP